MRLPLAPRYLSCSIFFLFLVSCTGPSVAAGKDKEAVAAVAVWDLEDLSPGASRAELGEFLTARVMKAMESKGVQLVERERLLRILEELRLGSSQLAEESTRLEVGKMLGARRMVFGGYLVIGAQLNIDLRMVDVETGRVMKGVRKSASGDLPEWLEATGEAAAELPTN